MKTKGSSSHPFERFEIFYSLLSVITDWGFFAAPSIIIFFTIASELTFSIDVSPTDAVLQNYSTIVSCYRRVELVRILK